MKVGALEINWHPGTSTLRSTVLQHMRDDPQVRIIAAQMARSEVKNYLAQIAEAAELPFRSSVEFIQEINRGVGLNASSADPNT
jgi:hypothetical protein